MDADPAGDAHGQRVRHRHHHHAPVGKPNQRRQRGGEQKQERGLAVGRRHAGNVGAGVDGHRQQFELLAADDAGFEGIVHLPDVDGRHEDVVADHRKNAVGDVEDARLLLHRQRQHVVDHRLEQRLVGDHGDDAEEHAQERGEGQRFLEGRADVVFLDDAVEGGLQDDDGEADQADLRNVEAEREDQHHRHRRLHDQLGLVAAVHPGSLLAVVVRQHFHDRRRQQRPVAGDLQLLEQHAGRQPDDEHRQGHRRHAQEELHEHPVHALGDQHVLRFADDGGDAAQRRADRSVHHQAAQEGAEPLHVVAGELRNGVFLAGFDDRIEPLDGFLEHEAAIDLVEADSDADDDGGDRERIEERGKERRDGAEHERQQNLVADVDQQLGEGEEQQILHEVDARHHEHQQQDHREVVLHLLEDVPGAGHADEQRFDGEQAPRLQRIAAQRHRQREDELQHQHPAGDEAARRVVEKRIDGQKGHDRELVPRRRGAEEVAPEETAPALGALRYRHRDSLSLALSLVNLELAAGLPAGRQIRHTRRGFDSRL